MDELNVNLRFYQELIKKRKEEHMFHSLLDIGSCSLHIIHGSFKTGAEILNILQGLEQEKSHHCYSVMTKDFLVQQWTLLAVNDVVLGSNAECN